MPVQLPLTTRRRGRMRRRSRLLRAGRDTTISCGTKSWRRSGQILRRVLDHLKEVVEHWYQLYVVHFGDKRSLSELEFRRHLLQCAFAKHQRSPGW